MRKLIFTLILPLVALVINPVDVFAYGYGEVEDPVAIAFKEGVTAASQGNWSAAKAKANESIKLISGHRFKGDHLKKDIDNAIAKKDLSRTGELLANVVYLSIKEKIASNLDNNLKDYPNNKARLTLAHKNYVDVLDGNIKKNDPANSQAILGYFSKALEAIGNPGLFGIGSKPTSVDGYKAAAANIDKSIMTAFPAFKVK